MLPPDLQRIQHILDYCNEIEKTIRRYGESFEFFDQDADYQRSIAFSILQIGELAADSLRNTEKPPVTEFNGVP